MLRSAAFFVALMVVLALGTDVASAQSAPQTDQEITWRTYSSQRSARVRVYPCDDARRPTTVVVDDRASNGEPITDDAIYFAEQAARELGFDPTQATFVFRFTPAAFTSGEDESGKTLLLRATFGRTGSGALGSPTWRVLTADGLDRLLDRGTL